MTIGTIVRHPFVQLLFVLLWAIGFTFLTDWYGFRSGWNILWMIFMPGAIGAAGNVGRARQLGMTVLLIILSLATVATTAAIFGLVY